MKHEPQTDSKELPAPYLAPVARPAIIADGTRMKRHLHAARRARISHKVKVAHKPHNLAKHGLKAHP